MKIGFVGVGRMGSNMARRLKECGFEISAVYDINAAAAQGLAQELGSVAADHPRVVTRLCDAILTVVTDDKAMSQEVSPFSDVTALANYVVAQLAEA